MGESSCSVDGCDRGATARGLCGKHYQRLWKFGSVELAVPSECARCGEAIPPRANLHGPGALYCSKQCRWAMSYERRQAAGTVKRPPPKPKRTVCCAGCGAEFVAARSDSRHCSRACSAKASRDSSDRTCSVDDCELPVRARSMCGRHYSAWHHETKGRNQVWDDAARDAWHRRRALKESTSTDEPVLRDVIAKRDGFKCHLCRKIVSMTTRWPDPMSPSLDHVVPLSLGGIHDPANVRLAHLRCNLRKGTRTVPEGDQLMLIG